MKLTDEQREERIAQIKKRVEQTKIIRKSFNLPEYDEILEDFDFLLSSEQAWKEEYKELESHCQLIAEDALEDKKILQQLRTEITGVRDQLNQAVEVLKLFITAHEKRGAALTAACGDAEAVQKAYDFLFSLSKGTGGESE